MFDGTRASGERELRGRLCAEGGGVLKFKQLRRLCQLDGGGLGEEGLRDEIVFTWVVEGGREGGVVGGSSDLGMGYMR